MKAHAHTLPVDLPTVASHFEQHLSTISRQRTTVRMLLCFMYLLAFIWMVALATGHLSRLTMNASKEAYLYLIGGFLLFILVQSLLARQLAKLKTNEEETIAQVVKTLFPQASYQPHQGLKRREVLSSHLFAVSTHKSQLMVTPYGSITLPTIEGELCIADMGISASDWREANSWDFITPLYKAWIQPLWGGRMESSMHGFRGIMASIPWKGKLRGIVVLVPDHLETHIGYLAHSIQQLKKSHGGHLVKLEDALFERYFAVYADDDVEARRVLTPAQMARISKLRERLGRNIMLSFTPTHIFYASAIPSGFLRPSPSSLQNAQQLLVEFYNECSFCLDINQKLS